MNLLLFASLNILLFSYIHWRVVPKLKTEANVDEVQVKLFRASQMAAFCFVRDCLRILIYSSLVTWAVLQGIQALDPATLSEVDAGLKTVGYLRDLVWQGASAWGVFGMFIILLGLAVHGYFRHKRKVSKIFAELQEEAEKDITAAYHAGNLEPKEPNARLKYLFQMKEELQVQSQEPNEPDQQNILKQKIEQVDAEIQKEDIRRRAVESIGEEEMALPRPRTTKERAMAIFFSSGMLDTLNAGSAWLFRVAMFFLIPAMLTMQGPVLSRVLDTKIVDLTQLKVSMTADAAFDAAKMQMEAGEDPDAPDELTPKDKEVISESARILENAALRPQLVSLGARLPSRSLLLRADAVRSALLDRAARRAPEVLESSMAPRGSNLNSSEKAVLTSFDSELTSKKPATELGKQIEKDLTKRASQSKDFRAKLKSSFKSFSQQASTHDLQTAFGKRVLGSMLGDAVSPEFAEFGERAFDKMGKEWQRAQRVGRDAAYKSVMADILKDGDLGRTVKNAQERKSAPKADFFEARPQIQHIFNGVSNVAPQTEIESKLSKYPPGLDLKEGQPAEAMRASKALESHARVTRNIGSQFSAQNITQPLLCFNDIFPKTLGAELTSHHGRTLYALERGGVSLSPLTQSAASLVDDINSSTGVGALPGSTRIAESKAAFQRARSYSSLRGFSRIGGVLIGEIPGKDASLRIDNFYWEDVNDKFRLVLVDEKGIEHRSAAHRKSTAYYALNYAADGRPTAITMISTPPLQSLKILVHPALIDSGMGYRLIELDRYVDTYARGLDTVKKAETLVMRQKQAYDFVWALRYLILAGEFADQFTGDLKIVKDFAERIVDNTVEEPFTPVTSGSLFREKVEFFDSDLVDLIDKHMGKQASWEAFGRAVADAVRKRWSNAAYLPENAQQKLVERWINLPPTFEIWSGVRERPFSLTFDDISSSGIINPKQFIDFILQVSFISTPSFLKGGDRETYIDENPYLIAPEAIRNGVYDRIANLPSSDSAHQVLADAAEFIVLQRFFRAAFDGRFHENFPLEKLVDFGKFLDEGRKDEPFGTSRWNVRDDGFNMLQAIQVTLVDTRLESCGDNPSSWGGNARGLIQKISRSFSSGVNKRNDLLETLREVHQTGSPSAQAAAEKAYETWSRNLADQMKKHADELVKVTEMMPQEDTECSRSLKAVLEDISLMVTIVQLRDNLGLFQEDMKAARVQSRTLPRL